MRQGNDEKGLSQVIHPEEGVRVGAPMVTRRQFAAAAAATAASMFAASAARADEDAAADAAAGGEQADSAAEAASSSTASDTNDTVKSILDFTDLSSEITYEPLVSFELPRGCQVFMNCDLRCAVLQANETARPMTVIGCLDLQTGVYTQVLTQPMNDGWAPSECHITDNLLTWVEMNNATDDWALYAVRFDSADDGISGSAVTKLDEGDADWLPPQVTAWEKTVVWQRMPDPAGPYVRQSSHAYRWELGGDADTAEEIWTSPGRFACVPSINNGVLTIVPRVNADLGTYYGITAIDLEHGNDQLDQLVLPSSVKPYFACRIGDDFAFSIEANYDSSTGDLGRMGYYIGRGEGPFLTLRREPSAQIGYVGGCYIMRSQLCHFVVDARAQTFAMLSAPASCVDYGDYPASAGTSTYFTAYAAVKDDSTGIPSKVLVRTFTLS